MAILKGQDRLYGKGNRVMNPATKLRENDFRCTVCLKIRSG